MIQCRSCSAHNPDAGKFCSECGAALSDAYAPTEIPAASDESSLLSSSSDSHHGRFLPGAKVADRYRIVSLVGKGGMGEVYRADDLKLGHTVALKFLPQDLADDPRRLEYFHTEVRLTRQISHPNVCRVYDIGEADGQLFLSMEYIDGEDLRVLLRRIGRLPQDKGIQIAQQLCAGLAAAHEKGVLHRDLKPANIMLDGRGQVRITDFGLAKLAEEGTKGEIAGTPAYMAPEQLTRGEATIQSDLYSLGLILYELFTGQAARKAGSVPELIRANEESSLSQSLELPGDIDPAVQRAISRCLEREPHERPLSANAVAASLPGGDPLAAALAAGETPSPEMVAAAGSHHALSLRAGVVVLSLFLLLLVTACLAGSVGPVSKILAHSSNDVRPSSLADDVHDSIQTIRNGTETRSDGTLPRYTVYGLRLVKPISDDCRGKSYSDCEKHRKLEFWYREPRRPLTTPRFDIGGDDSDYVTLASPSPYREGMINARTTPEGDLIELLINPENSSAPAESGTSTDEVHRQLLAAGGHTETESEEPEDQFIEQSEGDYPPNWRPPLDCDRVDLYRLEDEQRDLVMLEGYRGDQLVYFYTGPVIQDGIHGRAFVLPSPASNNRARLSPHLLLTVRVVVPLITALLAFINLRRGRADLKGAFFFISIVGTLLVVSWGVGFRHYLDFHREALLLETYLWPMSGYLIRQWLYYIALEPYVRRYWPQLLIGWNRVVEGRWRDSLLGRELLMGAALGVCGALVFLVTDTVLLSPETALSPKYFVPDAPESFLALLVSKLIDGPEWAIFFLTLLAVSRMLLRSRWLAMGSMITIGTLMTAQIEWGRPETYAHVIMIIGWYLLLCAAFTRWGFVSGMAFVFVSMILLSVPLSFSVMRWYLPVTLLTLAATISVAVFGFFTSVGGRPAFEAALNNRG